MSDETGQFEIYVRPYAAPDSGRWKASANGGRSPLWSAMDGELFDRDFGGARLSVSIAADHTFMLGPSVTIIRRSREYAGFGSAIGAGSYDVSPDGSRFLMIKNLDDGAQPSFVVVQSWLVEVADRRRRGEPPAAVTGGSPRQQAVNVSRAAGTRARTPGQPTASPGAAPPRRRRDRLPFSVAVVIAWNVQMSR